MRLDDLFKELEKDLEKGEHYNPAPLVRFGKPHKHQWFHVIISPNLRIKEITLTMADITVKDSDPAFTCLVEWDDSAGFAVPENTVYAEDSGGTIVALTADGEAASFAPVAPGIVNITCTGTLANGNVIATLTGTAEVTPGDAVTGKLTFTAGPTPVPTPAPPIPTPAPPIPTPVPTPTPSALTPVFDPNSDLPLYVYDGTSPVDGTIWTEVTDATGSAGETLFTNINDTPGSTTPVGVSDTWPLYQGDIVAPTP